jgi:transposase
LSPAAQEDLRRRVVAAVLDGMTQVEAASVFRVSTQSVSAWMKTYRKHGAKGLAARRRGRRPEEQKALSARQQRKICRIVREHTPDRFGLDGFLWTRALVRDLITARCGVTLSLTTVGKYLRDWGLTWQKPVRKAFEQDPAAVTGWLTDVYPAIVRQARAEKAIIFWADQTGLRSDHVTGRTWGPVGATPVVAATGQRFGVSVMSAIGNKGELFFTVYTGRMNSARFCAFLDRLIRQMNGRKIHLIVDRHPAHRAKATTAWLAEHAEQIQLHFLPGYSPELNPDELLNGDLKRAVLGKKRPTSRAELIGAVRAHLHKLQKLPARVRGFFGKPEVRYAA